MKRLLIVGNEGLTVHAMRSALRHATGVNLFGIVEGDGGSLPDALAEARPDVVIVDGIIDAARALDNVRTIREELQHALIILVVSEPDDMGSAQAMESGAIVCLWPDAEAPAIAGAPRSSARRARALAPVPPDDRGDLEESHVPCPLTARELEILRWVAEGHTNARIAGKLWVTEQTVKFHLSNIYRKLSVQNRTEASRYALVNDLFGTRRRTGRHAGLLPIDRDRTAAYANGQR